jgi:hypothetical protein
MDNANAVVFSCDEDSVQRIPFAVSQTMAGKLGAQRESLDRVNASVPGPQRYQLAREAGCCAAVAKGAKDRRIEPNQLYFPKTEMRVQNQMLRISSLKASLPMPASLVEEGRSVRGIVFTNIDGSWTGYLEVA